MNFKTKTVINIEIIDNIQKEDRNFLIASSLRYKNVAKKFIIMLEY